MANYMEIADIINTGLANGESYALINKKLMEAGCSFRLVHVDKVEGVNPTDIVKGGTSWTNQEMMEGFRMPGDEVYSPEDLDAPVYNAHDEEEK